MDKPVQEIDPKKIIVTDDCGNQMSLHSMLEIIIVNLTALNEIIFDEPTNTKPH